MSGIQTSIVAVFGPVCTASRSVTVYPETVQVPIYKRTYRILAELLV